ncbi:hemolysin family protein [Oceanivirga salmonicida]|uniref:hemolysin family protein n=2 Tax=Oceanivirga salmonicida TaxID=1769291 RepID=UPI0008359379|nr:hemolysin family protein [Oceanivirga salmonicida]
MKENYYLIIIAILIILIILLYIKIHNMNKKLMEINESSNEEDIKNMKNDMVEFIDTTVKEIMTPRTSIFALEMNEKLIDVLDEIIAQGFSRIPIYEENIDNIKGILYIKDILNADTNEKISNYVKKAFYVPETKMIYKLLEEFKTNQKHIAIIIDEYGGTAGLVSIEDILEEIVGEIRDEYDIEEDKIKKIADNIFEIQGETLVEEINDEIDIMLPVSEEYDTISGYVQYNLGKVAKVNDQINEKKYIIRVLESENKRIKKVKIILLNLGGNANE